MEKPEADVEWIKGCQICNFGLVIRFNELKKQGLSDRHVSRLMAKEAAEAHPDLADEFSAERIRDRMRHHLNKNGGKSPKRPKSEKPKTAWGEALNKIGRAAKYISNNCYDPQNKTEMKKKEQVIAIAKALLEELGERDSEAFWRDLFGESGGDEAHFTKRRVKSVYRQMSQKWHPDAGGTKEAMQAVNDFYQQLL